MTPMAGLSVRTSIQLQHRVFPIIPWVKKSSSVACLKTRDYNSSGPVRYIPKRSSNDQKSRIPPATETGSGNDFDSGLDADDRRIGVKHRGAVQRSNLFDKLRDQSQNEEENYSTSGSMQGLEDDFDDNMSFVDDVIFDEPEAVVEELNIYNKKYYHGDKGNKSKQDVEKMAIELLATRAFTAAELRKKLLGRRLSPDTVEAVINDFKIRGLINDGLYAEAYSRSRWSSSSWGPRKIKQALVNKGVGGEVARKAIKLVFEDVESGDEMSSVVGLSKVSMDHLFVQASKQWLRGRDAPKETRKSRIVRWLQYRGFDWGVTRTILNKLETEYPP